MIAPSTRKASAWIYEGVWSVLTELFHVPRQPPALPAASGAQVLSLRPCDSWLRYRKLSLWIILPLLVPTSVIVALLFLHMHPAMAFWLLLPGVIGLGAVFVWYVSIHLAYDTTWYVLTDRALRIRRGVWTLHETTITFENVQNVKITQGPLQRLFAFSNLVVETAGGGGGGGQQLENNSHVGLLEGIEAPAVLREQIMTRVRASRSAGLGDEHDSAHASPGAPASWSPAHLEALREIATHVARLRARSG